MDYVENNHEAAERVKNWWKKYGNVISFIVILGMALIVGMQYWNRHELKVSAQASAVYDNLLLAYSEKNTAEVAGLAATLKSDYSGSNYAALGVLILAKQNIDAKQYDQATTNLQWVSQHTSDTSFHAIATLRLARVLLEQNQAPQALDEANKVSAAAFLGEANLVKGDAYLQLKQLDKAKAAYQQALAATDATSPLYNYIQMRLYSI